jgi:Uma2 family endonuclease
MNQIRRAADWWIGAPANRRSSRDAAELPPRRCRDDTMVMPLTRHFTAADLATMPDDGKRYEVIRGELFVTPAPGGRHQPMVTRLLLPLGRYLEAHGLSDQLLTPPADITLSYDTLVQPDLLVADTAAFIRSGRWTDVTNLFLVVELISPSSARTDRETKRPEYQQYGIPQYWIVDGEQRQVEVWTPNAVAPTIERERLVWRHPALDAECVIDLVRLFDFG